MSVVVKPRPQPSLAPLTHDASQVQPTLRAAYSDRTAALMAWMCQAAYDLPDKRAEVRADLRAGGFELAAVTRRAFLAVSHDLSILTWRGTACAADWWLDLSARRVPLPGTGLRVHEGFLEAFEQDRAAVESAIGTHAPPGESFFITGHSLGGALAQLAAAKFDSDALSACYTFGSPRVGTQAFSRAVHTPHYRVVNDWDIVPGVPAPFWRGYRHSGDVRLLVPGHPPEAQDRDRSVGGRLLVDIAASVCAAVTRQLPVVSDHMIWNYRARLEEIAAARAPAHAAPAA